MSDELDQRINKLDEQIRHEADLRIIALVMEYRKHAGALLDAAEMTLCNEYLWKLLENPQVDLPPEVMAVFQKLDSNAETKALFDRLFTLVSAKTQAQEIETAARRRAYIGKLIKSSGYDSTEPGSSTSTRSNKA